MDQDKDSPIHIPIKMQHYCATIIT